SAPKLGTANAETPVGKTDAVAASAPDMVAHNIPLPTWRPQTEASAVRQPEAARSADAVAALLAMHHPDTVLDASTARQVAVPAPKPEDRVRTSPKADRVQPRLDPEATAVIVPVADRRIPEGGSAAASVIAANFIRTAPEQVYLDGFQPRGQTSDHRRFTGSAVKFLPIASFK
ncbi:peptidase M15, partial [Mesorhizobium intechi]